LWRLQHGELEYINPVAFVVHIGINDVIDIERKIDMAEKVRLRQHPSRRGIAGVTIRLA